MKTQKNDINPPEVTPSFSPNELAKAYGIPPRIVFSAIRRKELKTIRFSSQTFRVTAADADAWIESLKQ